jgi:hypothetical protein
MIEKKFNNLSLCHGIIGIVEQHGAKVYYVLAI